MTSGQLSQRAVTFYWVSPTAPNSPNTVTFTLNYTDSQGHAQSATATAKFTVLGPTSVSVSTPLGNWEIITGGSEPLLGFGLGLDPDIGIKFDASAQSPAGHPGTYEWVQLIISNTTTSSAGSTTLTCTTVPATGLDNRFPYNTGLSTADSPGVGVPPSDTKVTDAVNFVMYLMWRPGLTPEVPVPLGSVSWQISGDAVQNSGSWTVQADSTKHANPFQLGASYPSWTGKIINGGQTACH